MDQNRAAPRHRGEHSAIPILQHAIAHVMLASIVKPDGGSDIAPLTLPPFSSRLTLDNSVRDMWNADVVPACPSPAVFSGGWPYLKLALMLLAVFTDGGFIHKRLRIFTEGGGCVGEVVAD